ncbi:uncharacterized protein LOC144455036 isoform X2 [Phascolarctos cinereus]
MATRRSVAASGKQKDSESGAPLLHESSQQPRFQNRCRAPIGLPCRPTTAFLVGPPLEGSTNPESAAERRKRRPMERRGRCGSRPGAQTESGQRRGAWPAGPAEPAGLLRVGDRSKARPLLLLGVLTHIWSLLKRGGERHSMDSVHQECLAHSYR